MLYVRSQAWSSWLSGAMGSEEGDLIELLGTGTVGALDRAVDFGRVPRRSVKLLRSW